MNPKQDLLKSIQLLSEDERIAQFQIEELETRLEMAALGTDATNNGTCNGTCTNNGCNDGCW